MNLKALILLCSLTASAYAAEQPAALQPKPAQPSQDAQGGQNVQGGQNANEEPGLEEPQVTITAEPAQTIEEFRAGGKLYAIKITPKHGHPYYLIDDRGDGRFARQEGLDSGVRVPQWVIKKF